MSDDTEIDALKPDDGPSDRELFDEVTADLSGVAAFRRSLSQAEERCEFEDLGYAQDGAQHLQALLGLLIGEDAEMRPPKQGERNVSRQAQSLAIHSADALFSHLAELNSPVIKGDALEALAALVEATFYLGRRSTAALQASIRAHRKRKPRGPIEKLKCKIALQNLYRSNPIIGQGLHRDDIRTAVEQQIQTSVSLSTLDRSIKELWPDDK